MIVEICDELTKTCDDMLENGWKRQFTWLEHICWLDKRA
jgi:hypothetical protein